MQLKLQGAFMILLKIYDKMAFHSQNFIQKLRAWHWKNKIKKEGGQVGHHFSPRKRTHLSLGKNAQVIIGNNVILANDTEIFVGPNAKLFIGEGVFIGRGTLVASNLEIKIGARTQIAHQVTLIDTDHQYKDHHKPMVEQGSISAKITIGEDTWVGAHAILLKGVRVGKKAVIGAGAVVTKDVLEGTSVVGNPAKEISRNA